jgi:hypothetical protein
MRFLFPPGEPAEVTTESLRARGRDQVRLVTWWRAVARPGHTALMRVWNGETRLEFVAAFLAAVFAIPIATMTMATDASDLGVLPVAVIAEGLIAYLVTAWALPARLPDPLRTRIHRWAAFRRYLKRFPSITGSPAAGILVWEEYLEYAVALGVARTVEGQLRAVPPWGMLCPRGPEHRTDSRVWSGPGCSVDDFPEARLDCHTNRSG